jgi:hypothetical protein
VEGSEDYAGASNTVILEGSNCSLGSIAAVGMGRDELVVNVFLAHGVL